MKVYEFPSSPNCLKVRAVAYELGLDPQWVTINVLEGESRVPAFRVLNPNGLVPVLVEGDFILWESNAILSYLATLHPVPALLPADARGRADVDRWLHWQSEHLGPVMSKVALEFFLMPMSGKPESQLPVAGKSIDDFQRHCAALEDSLGDKEYIAGRLSIADFAVGCVLHTFCLVGLDTSCFPTLDAWLQRLLRRRSMRQAIADSQAATRKIYTDQ